MSDGMTEMLREEAQAAEAEDALGDLPETFRPVAKRFGREMFALVMNAGVARQAVEVLARGVGQHPQARQAIQTLAQAFNETSTAMVKLKGWKEEELLRCDAEIQRAFAGALFVPESSIIIEH